MDRRILFFIVFIFTLTSTALVTVVCILTEQRVMDTVLYSLATMWITGIISQLLVQHLYLGIVRPLEEQKYEEKLAHVKAKINIEEVEYIDQVKEMEKAVEAIQEAEVKRPVR